MNKIELIRHLLINSNIDCLCLTETWLSAFMPDSLIQVEGYRLLRLDRPRNKGSTKGGGICIYSKFKYEVEQIQIPEHNMSDVEILTVRLTGATCGSLIVSTLYRPPKGNVENAIRIVKSVIHYVTNTAANNIIVHVCMVILISTSLISSVNGQGALKIGKLKWD